MTVKTDFDVLNESQTGLVSNALDLIVRRDSETLVLRRHLERFIAQHVAAPLLVNDLVVVIDEALTNIFLHSHAGCDPRAHAQVKLQFQSVNRGLSKVTVTIIDDGLCGVTYNPFRSYLQNHLNLGDPESGLGIRLILRVMDEVGYEVSTTGANHLHLQKYFLTCEPDANYSVRLGAYLVQQQILTPTELGQKLEEWEHSPFADLGEWLLASSQEMLERELRRAIVHARTLVAILEGDV
ncbi:MAG: ATP-binding protein [Candidatus Sericytochromatia bacterium]|nr:ATP-binding protein [Candidatus Sericytochromatia bacterium]